MGIVMKHEQLLPRQRFGRNALGDEAKIMGSTSPALLQGQHQRVTYHLHRLKLERIALRWRIDLFSRGG